ncbi:hypothetical protein BRC88_07605 [Halobacteriales archaeon QS_4_69_225]|nr:MAG: hypothetical protein BRC88_07605 [Halobacteriales archaeon QS_4_69_225]
MSPEVARITEFVQEQVGDGLRTVAVVTPGGWELHYLRSDLKREYDEDAYGEVVESFRLEESSLAPATGDRPVGDRLAVVHYHENAFVLQFPVEERRSVLVSVTSDAGRELLEFIEECRSRVDD